MEIQKPTVLDAGRIASELNRTRSNVIANAFVEKDGISFILGLGYGSWAIHFLIEKRYAFLGMIGQMPQGELRSIQALSGYVIESAEQLGFDRVVRMNLEKSDRLGRKIEGSLIFELIPNKGNAVLVDADGAIKWALRKRKLDRYKPPSPLKKPTVLNIANHIAILSTGTPSDIIAQIYGLNAIDIRNLDPDAYNVSSKFLSAISEYATAAIKPGPAWIIRRGDDAMGYSLISPVLDTGEKAEEFESAMLMYPSYYKAAAGQSAEDDRRAILTGALEKEIAVLRQKLIALDAEIGRARNAGEFKLRGDLILANMDRISKGAKIVTLRNFEGHLPEMIVLELDPSKNAAANAGEYFAKFKKASSSLKILEKRLESTREHAVDLENVQMESGDNLDRLEDALITRGLASRGRSSKRKTVEKRLPYKRYIAANGWEILVGRTSADNDELTFKIARKDDYWFHAWQAAGSHTVLRLPDRNAVPDKKTLEEAAALAAYYSRARTAGKVPVAYTQVKYVRKPRNFAPGKVLVEREKQLIIRPADIKKYRID